MGEATEKGGIEAMLQLRAEGKINEVSLGMNSSEYLLKYIRKYPTGTFDTIMMAGCFNLIDQDGLELLQECQARGIRVTNVGILHLERSGEAHTTSMMEFHRRLLIKSRVGRLSAKSII